MGYKFEIKYDMDQGALNEGLIKYYGYPLLNFALVIADVLDGIPVFSKTVIGKKITDIKKEVECLEKIKKITLKSLQSYLEECHSSEFSWIKNGYSKEEQIKDLSLLFQLKPFFEVIDQFLTPLRAVMEEFEPPFPEIFKTPAIQYSWALGDANLVSFFWAHILRERFSHWGNIINLISWFIENLGESVYAQILDFPKGKKDVGGNTRVLKNQYHQFIERYGIYYVIVCRRFFPPSDKRPYYPKETAKDSEDLNSKRFIVAVKFYENEIETTFSEEGKLRRRSTVFDKGKHRTEIRDFIPPEEELKFKKILLEIK